MKTIRESFLVIAFTILWIIVLPIAGLFEATVKVSDAIQGLVVQHPGNTLKVGTRVTL